MRRHSNYLVAWEIDSEKYCLKCINTKPEQCPKAGDQTTWNPLYYYDVTLDDVCAICSNPLHAHDS